MTVALSPAFPSLSYTEARHEPEAFRAKLRAALLSTGFFYLSDITNEEPEFADTWDAVFKVSNDFFDLPQEEKEKIAMVRSRHFRGYSAVGAETTAGKQDLREQIDLAPHTEPVLDYPPSSSAPIQLSLYGPNQYPAAIPSFARVIEEYREICNRISQVLVARIAESLTPNPKLFTSLFEVTNPLHPDYSRMKVVRYPPVKPGDDGLGVGAHKDGGGITLLAQDQTGGLQVQRWDGAWVDVAPKPYALVINVGQVIERMSCGTYPATTHRVLPTKGARPRTSIPFFFCPPLLTPLIPLKPGDLHEDLINAALERHEVSEVAKGDLHEEIFGRAAWRGITRSHHEVWKKYYGEWDTLGGPDKRFATA